MGRYRYLFKNIGLLTLSSFATKLLSFFLVPLYTNILSTTEYGIYDMFNVTVGILMPVLTLNIEASVMRFPMDSKYDRKTVISVGIKYFTIGMVIVTAGLLANYCLGWSSVAKDYVVYLWLMYLAQSLSGIVLAYARGTEHIADLSLSSIVNSVVVIVCNILFLIVFKWGLPGYFLANIIGPIFQCIYLLIRTRSISAEYLFGKHKNEEREMITYSRPMIANSIAWWINNTSDRYIVTFFCGLAENGVYSVSSKIPSVLNSFQVIFSQAWSLSAVKDFDSEDKNGFFASTYKSYNCFMVFICSLIIISDKFLAKILYAKDFYMAWKYVPWLSIAIVFGSLAGYIGGFFSAVKNSKIFAQSTIIGAVVNVALNLVLTPVMGALGAAIATAACYFVTWMFRFIQSQKIIRLKINIIRDIWSYIVLTLQAVILIVIDDGIIVYILEIILMMLEIILYYKDIESIVKKTIVMIKNRRI